MALLISKRELKKLVKQMRDFIKNTDRFVKKSKPKRKKGRGRY